MPKSSLHLMNVPLPPALHTALPLRPEALDQIATVLGKRHPECLPHIRWLLLGPYANSKVFPPGLCVPPSVEKVDQLIAALERGGLASIARTISLIANRRRERIAINLDHLESLSPESWNHPAQEIRRPWQLEQLLELCRRRIESATTPERVLLLNGIAEKLQKALEMEARAAERRREAQEKTQKLLQGLRKPRKKKRKQ